MITRGQDTAITGWGAGTVLWQPSPSVTPQGSPSDPGQCHLVKDTECLVVLVRKKFFLRIINSNFCLLVH